MLVQLVIQGRLLSIGLLFTCYKRLQLYTLDGSLVLYSSKGRFAYVFKNVRFIVWYNLLSLYLSFLCVCSMGGSCSVPAEEREAKQKNAEIERELRKAAKEYENTVKILLLGELLVSYLTS